MHKLLCSLIFSGLIILQARADNIGAVFYIALENHNSTQPKTVRRPIPISHSKAAPYINSLVTSGNPNADQVS